MKKIIVSILLGCTASAFCAKAADFGKADALFASGTDYAACKNELLNIRKQVSAKKDIAEVCWRLARVQVVIGSAGRTKEERRSLLGEGVKYAAEAIAADPSDARTYMWHCACVGRECQTRPLMEQAKAVPTMMDDLDKILNKLGRTDYSEAWQALAEIFFNHPFKSNDAAVNYYRQAALTIPAGESRVSTLLDFAKLLDTRKWSAEKRSAEARGNAKKFASAGSNIEKYAVLDGSLVSGGAGPWTKAAYASMSDREEASAILKYAEASYKKHPHAADKEGYALLVKYVSERKQ